MKVLHINWSGDLGGAENFAYELARAFSSRFIGTPTIAYMSNRSVLGNRAEREGIRVVEFNMRSGFDVLNFRRYISFIRKERFDIIHDHNGPPLVRLSKIWAPHSVFIQHIHGPGVWPEQWERLRVRLWKRVTSFMVDRYIANSKYTKEIAARKERIQLSLISVVYNGIDIDKFERVTARVAPTYSPRLGGAPTIREKLGIKEDEWVVGTVGRLTLQKGIDKFIQVAYACCFRLFQSNAERVPDAKFVIVGEGELRSELEHLVRSKSLVDRVIFTGRREDVPDVLRSFDVFLLTSNWEPFGISLVEAMTSGVPVVAFKVGGVPEVVCEECGILIPPDIKRVAESILFLRENPDVAKRMGATGREWARDKFNINRTAKEVENIYRGFVK